MAHAIGAAGAILFVVTFLLDGLTRPEYSSVRQPVSALALGGRGWIQTLNFLIHGAAIAIGGIAMTGDNLLLGMMLGIFGLGLVASGLFRMDPMRGHPPGTPEDDPEEYTGRHKLHDHAGAVVFFSLPVTAAVAAFLMPGVIWTIVSGVVAVVLIFTADAFGKAWERDAPKAGLTQRAF